ncbi:MAG TPA: hypothetical protein DCX54_01995 [Flavobacteriales bacterium]|nr:hypothetical protein [Flavobacteriales bacterium]
MRTAIAIASICLIFSSCKKDNEVQVSPTSQFTARVGGSYWAASNIQASVYNGSIVLIGESVDGTVITLSLNGDTVGVYSLDATTSSVGTYSLGSGKGFSTAGGPDAKGEITIESINKTDNVINGSFGFDAVRSIDDSLVSITDGRFVNIVYSNLPLGVENNKLSVEVNGGKWSPLDIAGFVAFKTLFISAYDADGTRSLSFELPYDIAPGKYNLNYFTKYKAYYITSDERTHYAVKGNLEITSHNIVNNEIEALFDIYMEEHEGTGNTRFTNGEFKITYE